MPDRTLIRNTLIELLEADTGEKYLDLDDSTNLREGLGLDSVDVVSIISQVERHYKIRLSPQELEKLVTLADVLDLLELKLSAPAQESAPVGLNPPHAVRGEIRTPSSTGPTSVPTKTSGSPNVA